VTGCTPVAWTRAVIAALVALGVVTGIGPAWAHTAMIASDPPANAALSAGPDRVSATFNEPLQTTFAAMTVVGPDANLWSAGDPEIRGATVGVAVRPLGPSGEYTVNYRVTSADGHAVSGSWSFTVTMPGTGAPGPAVANAKDPGRIPLWPFIVGAAILITGMSAWALRRRS
jgi:methionine-rich copper-binding protein CopC